MRKFWFWLVCLSFCLTFSTAHAQRFSPQNFILNGDFSSKTDSWQVPDSPIARSTVVDTENPDSKAIHIEINALPDTKPWEAALFQRIPYSFNTGEKLVFSGRARSPQGLMLYAYLEESGEPFSKQATVKMPLSPEWQTFEATGTLTRDFAANALTAGFQLAHGTGNIEIADLKVVRAQLSPEFTGQFEPVLAPDSDFSLPIGASWIPSAEIPMQSRVVDITATPNSKIGATGIKKALQLEVDSPLTARIWDGRLAAPPIPAVVRKGDMILVQFWGRSAQKNRVSPVFQQAKPPNGKSLMEFAYLRPRWKKFTFYNVAKTDFAPGDASFEIQFGGVKGIIELTGAHLENLGPISETEAEAKFGLRTIDYYGNEIPNDEWKAAAFDRIEKYRKGGIEIRVVDGMNNPIPDAKVKITQTKQAFRFGTAVNEWLFDETPDGENYRAQVKKLFNTAVLENDMKWPLTDNNPEVTQRGVDSVKWLRDNGLEVRGHNMIWGSWRFSPSRLAKLSPEAARLEIKNHVFEIAERYKGQVYVWDVVNEAVTNKDVFEKLGWDLFPQIFKWAKEADNKALLAYNDYDISNEAFDTGTHRAKVEGRIQQLLDAKVPVDILGDQAHMFTPLTPIPRVLEIWDGWSKKYGKPIEITEFDVGINDDAVQEKYIRDYMIAAFSQPNVQAFIFWGFWEKSHWRSAQGGALFRSDWTPRPAALTVEDLILRQWRTNTTLVADRKGIAQTRGFLGDYEIQVTANGRQVTTHIKVGKKGASKRVVVN